MPVRKCSNGKYRIGSGDCMYKSKASADRAYKGYLGATHMNEGREITGQIHTSHEMDNGHELDLTVDYIARPGRPAQMYGDDAHPEEAGEIEIVNITNSETGRVYDDIDVFDLDSIEGEIHADLENREPEERDYPRYEESRHIEEKVDLKVAEVDEDEMHADDIKHMTRLAGIPKEMADEEKKDVDFIGITAKPVKEHTFSTFKMLEEDLATRNTVEESSGAMLTVGAEVETPNGHGTVVEVHDDDGVCTYLIQLSSNDGESGYVELEPEMVHAIGEEIAQEGNPFDPMDAGPDYGYDGDSDEQMEQAADYARDLFQDAIKSNEMVKAGIADLRGGDVHSMDREGTLTDILGDIAGTIQQSLVANDMDILEFSEIQQIASDELLNHLRGPQMEDYSLEKGSYDRLVTEMILDELKLGKDAAEIAQTLSFDEGDVSRIVDAANKVMESKKK